MKKDQSLTKEEAGLYRDDGLSMIEGNGSTMDRKLKELITWFKEEGLTIICDTNLKRVKFLDVLFDLENNTYQPYHITITW